MALLSPSWPLRWGLDTAWGRAAALTRVTEVKAFGSNPGELRMLAYAPARLAAARPLVVLLHGCGQDAARFAADSGWLALARQHRLAMVMPEQGSRNNRGRCFNWFLADDARRGSGEAMSIRQMVRLALKRFRSDPRRVFIAGFSAGGGMAAAMLAAYPAVFAGGGVVAGMPVGSARTELQALLRMRRAHPLWSGRYLAAGIRAGLPTRASSAWPRLAVWQGGRDRVVNPDNAVALATQWSDLHGWGAAPTTTEQVAQGISRSAWGRAGRPAVELWSLDDLGHTASRWHRACLMVARPGPGSSMPASRPPRAWRHSGAWRANGPADAARLSRRRRNRPRPA